MPRFTPIDLSLYPIADVLEALSFEAYLARDRADLQTRWESRRAKRPELPAFNTLFLEDEPSSVILEVGSYREMMLRAEINDRIRSLTLAGALGAALDHIGITYYRTPRLLDEDDEAYRQRLSLAPESWSTAGPVGAYLFHGLSASSSLRDIAVYSEDEGVCLAPRVRVVTLPHLGVSIADEATMRADILARLSRRDIRPMSDKVTVEAATTLPFDLTINLGIRSGAAAATAVAAARQRVLAYCSGRLRWAGEGVSGPVWLIGRTLTTETLAGVAIGGDPNILEADVVGSDVNPPHPAYNQNALAGVGTDAFTPLPAAHTAHLFNAPVIGALTINTTTVMTGWAS